MNIRFSKKWLLLAAWFVVLAILGAYSMGSGDWIRSHLPFMKAAVDKRDTINVAPYVYGKTPLVTIGEIKNPDNAYIHLNLRFRAESTEAHPNVFQTAPVNRGMRMEISGSTATIIVPDLSVSGGLKGLTLTTALKTEQWYALEVEALNGAYVRVTLDGQPVADYASASLAMETSQLMVGGGFDASRAFRGVIENISITKGNFPPPTHENITVEDIETVNATPYINGQTPPVSLGEIKNPHNASIHLQFNFRLDSAEGHPNLFQTAPVNRGLRMEISGSTAAIIVADSSVKGGYRVIGLSNSINIGQWYKLEINALNGVYVRAILDEQNVADVSSAGISLDASQILVGGGFDNTRVFRGEIKDISIKKGNLPSWRVNIERNIPTSLRAVLSLIANVGIVLSILLYFLIKKVNRPIEKITNYFRGINQNSLVIIASLILFQTLLMFGFPAYKNVVITYLFLFAIGINLYIVLTPSFLKEKFFYYLLIPINGLILLSVLGGYFIGFNINIKFLVPILLVITLLGFLINYTFNKTNFLLFSYEFKSEFPLALIFLTLIVTPLILFLISPVLFSEHTTSPYRIGPDLATYAKMAQYLLDGGTWTEANLISSEFAGMSPGEINRYSDATMSWPFMYYFRWGLTAFQATVTTITFSTHVFETAFISMAIPYLFLCGFVLFWLKNRMNLGIVPALLGAIAFTLNPNMINLWYEGFYGNAFALCLFILILLIFTYIRGIESFKIKNNIQSILLLSLVFAASLLSYGEGVLFVLPPFLVIVFFVDLLMNRSIKFSPYLVILGSACIGLLIVLPGDFIVHWAILTLKQLTEEGGNGYMQPLWALPHEILGISNIYLDATPDVAGKLLFRSETKLILGLIFSCLILYSALLFFRQKSRAENALYLASILVVALFAFLIYTKSKNNNYTYMKMYVFFLPILFITFWSSLFCFYEKHVLNKVSRNLFFLFLAFPIAINGLVYIFQYKEEAILIDKSKIALHEELKQINFDNVIMYPVSMHTLRTMYPAILSTPWMIPEFWNATHWKDKPYYLNVIDHKVFLFLEKEPAHLYTIKNEQVIFQNQNYLIIDSGKTVRDGINSENNSIDFDVYTHSTKKSILKDG